MIPVRRSRGSKHFEHTDPEAARSSPFGWRPNRLATASLLVLALASGFSFLPSIRSLSHEDAIAYLCPLGIALVQLKVRRRDPSKGRQDKVTVRAHAHDATHPARPSPLPHAKQFPAAGAVCFDRHEGDQVTGFDRLFQAIHLPSVAAAILDEESLTVRGRRRRLDNPTLAIARAIALTGTRS